MENAGSTVANPNQARTLKKQKLLQRMLTGPANVRFGELVTLLHAFGFRLSRVNGSHHIFVHDQVDELVNVQNVGGRALPYQIKQVIKLVEKYNLHLESDA